MRANYSLINDPAASCGVLGYQRTQQAAGNGPVEIQIIAPDSSLAFPLVADRDRLLINRHEHPVGGLRESWTAGCIAQSASSGVAPGPVAGVVGKTPVLGANMTGQEFQDRFRLR